MLAAICSTAGESICSSEVITTIAGISSDPVNSGASRETSVASAVSGR